MTYFKLGDGKYCVSQSHSERGPSLTLRRLPKAAEVGEVLDGVENAPAHDFDLIIDVATPEAAAVLLMATQGIAFVHGIRPA